MAKSEYIIFTCKKQAMAFRMPQKKIKQPNIQINGSNIEFVENVMFLGITINNKLNLVKYDMGRNQMTTDMAEDRRHWHVMIRAGTLRRVEADR